MEGIETRIGGFVILCMGLAITQSSAAIERLNVAQNLQDDQRKRKAKNKTTTTMMAVPVKMVVIPPE
jgi:hypothetical protein